MLQLMLMHKINNKTGSQGEQLSKLIDFITKER